MPHQCGAVAWKWPNSRSERSSDSSQVVRLNLNTMLDERVPDQSEEMPEPAAKGTTSIPVAGIGGSAGGLEVFKHLLADLPADTGLAIVFVQHLDPKHHSLLREILS